VKSAGTNTKSSYIVAISPLPWKPKYEYTSLLYFLSIVFSKDGQSLLCTRTVPSDAYKYIPCITIPNVVLIAFFNILSCAGGQKEKKAYRFQNLSKDFMNFKISHLKQELQNLVTMLIKGAKWSPKLELQRPTKPGETIWNCKISLKRVTTAFVGFLAHLRALQEQELLTKLVNID